MSTTTVLEVRVAEPHPLLRGLAVVGTALVAGLALGAVARGWMRLITDDPEFTWAGTLFIVAAFGLHGLGTGITRATRQATRRRPVVTASRFVGGVLSMGLFGAAGAIMLPTVAAASAARHRTDWPRWVRVALMVVAVIVPLQLAAEAGRRLLQPRVAIGFVLFVLTYAVIVEWLGPVVAPLDDGRRLRRTTRVIAGVVAVLAVAMVGLLLVGVATSG